MAENQGDVPQKPGANYLLRKPTRHADRVREVMATKSKRTDDHHVSPMHEDTARMIVAGELLTKRARDRADKAEKLLENAEQLSLTDPLTGLPNRRYLFGDESQPEEKRTGEIYRMFAEAERNGHVFSVVFIDLDNFKQVNEKHDHAVGDEVLKELGKRLAKFKRASDFLGRYGGEEFILVQPQNATIVQEGLDSEMARLKHDISQTPFPKGIHQTISIGIASHYPGDPAISPQELVRRANIAEHVSKERGKDQWTYYSPEIEKPINSPK